MAKQCHSSSNFLIGWA